MKTDLSLKEQQSMSKVIPKEYTNIEMDQERKRLSELRKSKLKVVHRASIDSLGMLTSSHRESVHSRVLANQAIISVKVKDASLKA